MTEMVPLGLASPWHWPQPRGPRTRCRGPSPSSTSALHALPVEKPSLASTSFLRAQRVYRLGDTGPLPLPQAGPQFPHL